MKKYQSYNDAYKDKKFGRYYSSYKCRSNRSVNFIFLRHHYQEHGKKIKLEFLSWSPKQQMRDSYYYFSTQYVQLCHLLSSHVSLNSNNLFQVLHSTVIQIKLLSLKSYQAIKCVWKSDVFLKKEKQTDLDSISSESLPMRLSKSIFITVL